MERSLSNTDQSENKDPVSNLALQMLLDEIDEAVLWEDPVHGFIVDSNRSAERLLGLPRTALFGRTFASFVVRPLPPGACTNPNQALDSTFRSVELSRADGTLIQVEAHQVRTGALDAWVIRDMSGCYHLEQAFIDAEQKYQGLVTRSPVGIALVNERGQLVEWNQYMETLTGKMAESVLGHYIWDIKYELLAPADRAENSRAMLESRLRKLLEDGQPNNITRASANPLLRADGEVRIVELNEYPLRTSRGYWIGTVMIDLTDRLRAEQEARRQAVRSQALASSAARLQEQGDLKPILNDFCKEIGVQLDLPVVSILLSVEDGGSLKLAASSGLPESFVHEFEPIGSGVYERQLEENGDLLVIDDLQRIEGVPNLTLSRQENLRTAVVVILHQENLVLGVLNACSQGTPVTITPDQISLLRAFADLANVAVQRQRYLNQVLDASKRLRSMSRRLIDVQEKESQRLARELHDEIGQNLTFLKMMLELLPENLSPEMKQKGASSKEIVSTLIGQIRTLAMDLRPSLLDDLGLVHALTAYFERLEINTGIKVEFAHSKITHRYSREIETTVYRVIQEALSNVARHARVKEAWVRIWESQGDLYFQVEDAGLGFQFQTSQFQQTFGLLGMRERVELCNGNLEIDSQPGQGTRITAWVPLRNEDLGRKDYDDFNHTR